MTPLPIDRRLALVVEEDEPTRLFLLDNLRADGFDVVVTADAGEGLLLAEQQAPDLAIVAVNGGSGREFAKAVRAEVSGADKRLPLILLGGDRHEIDTLRAFDAGADDYVPKPFSYPELQARARALLRRVELDTSARQEIRSCGGLVANKAAFTVTIDGEEIEPLSKKEFRLLWMLAGDGARVYTKDELCVAMGIYSRNSRTLDSHCCRLRAKLDPEKRRFIANVWGVGYRLLTDVREATVKLP